MNSCIRLFLCAMIFVSVALGTVAVAALKLNGIFSDHMVLQRGRPVPVFGTGKAGEVVEVVLGDDAVSGAVDGEGAWRVELPARGASAEPLEWAVGCQTSK